MTTPPVVVVGAGPGGMSAALWCAHLGLEVTVLERRDRPGGQLHEITHPLDNLPGLPGVAAHELAHTLASQLAAGGIRIHYDHSAVLDADALRVRCDARRASFDASAVVIAAGTRRRSLGIPGERLLVGRGVAYNVGATAATWRDRNVMVVGGGDDAFEHAVLVAPYARTVTLVHRSDRYTARHALVARALAAPNVALRPFTHVEAIEGAGAVESVRLRTLAGTESVAVAAVFICVGPQPDTQGMGIPTAPSGYIPVDRLQRTMRPGVWAVGDVCCPEAPTVATAIGQGAVAAKCIARALAGGVAPSLRPQGAVDRLSVTGISLPARIGVYPRERRRMQTLTFDVGFEVDAAAAAHGDALSRTIDYAAVERAIAEVLASQHFNLIESVAERVAAVLLNGFASPKVSVRVTKPGVPQRQSTASVEIFRERS